MASESTTLRAWTDAQRRGITTVGKSLLMSAAAGSGKTTVLAERCVHLVCDTPEPCELSELLVVTFTEPAAAEMKSRIGAAMSRRHAEFPSPHTLRQVALLDRANVGTLHGFCSRVLRQHFHKVGLDPDFLILDGDEAGLLKREVARELFEERYEDDADDRFRTFVDSYGNGNDEQLVKMIVAAHDTLGSMLDPTAWAEAARDRIVEAVERPMNESKLGKAYLQEIERALATLEAEAQSAAVLIKSLGQFPAYLDRLRECEQIIRVWRSLVDVGELDELAGESDGMKFPAVKPMSNSIPNKEQAKAALDAVTSSLKNGRWRAGLRFKQADWHDGLERILPHVDTFLSLTSQYTLRYADAKARQNTLDFADLERFALRVLKEDGPGLNPSPIARGYHRQFKHVLVDEYQDINQVQDAILCLVSRECLHAPGGTSPTVTNLFCVGDVKQSIYRFRLAEPAQFIRRRADYTADGANGEVINLQENFRSRAPLLNAINELFARMMTEAAVDLEYDRSQWLYGKRAFPEPIEGSFTGGPIELHLVPKDATPAPAGGDDDIDEDAEPVDRTSREAGVLAKRILEITGHAGGPAASPAQVVVDRRTGTHRPARFGDVVVLLRSMRFKSDAFADAFRKAGIPVHSESATGYFEATEINDLLSLLQVLDNRLQDIPMAAVLRSPLFQIANADDAMATIRLAYGDAPSKENVFVAGGGSAGDSNEGREKTGASAPGRERSSAHSNKSIPFHEAVVRYANEQTDALAAQLREACATLDRWRDVARQRPVAELVWLILQETGYLAYVAGLNNGQQRQANVLELYDRAGQFGTFRRQGLSRFLEFLEKLKTESDLGQASIASPADDVVRIMSIHRSKGLEFPIVCVPDLGKAINLKDCQGTVLMDRELGLGFEVVDLERMIRYPSLASKVVSTRLRQQTLAEEMRVLYVAMTRAEEHLILTGTCTPKQADKWAQEGATHAGALPVEAILNARSMLDWLGPAAAATGASPSPPVKIVRHDEDAPMVATGPTPRDEAAAARLTSLAELNPLPSQPAVDAEAQSVVDRLTRVYAFDRLNATPASLSVTAITHGPGHARLGAGSAGDSLSRAPIGNGDGSTRKTLVELRADGKKAISAEIAGRPVSDAIDRALPLPPMLGGGKALTAADRGTATHAVLEHLDFSDVGSTAAVRKQIAKVVDRHRLTADEAAAVDVEAIDWFLKSPIGQLVCGAAKTVVRELPLYLAQEPEGMAGVKLDPMDYIMVRGRIDLLVPDADGYAIVDYKTDRVSGDALTRRAADYALQLHLYRKAILKITGKRVTRAVLVFLTARQMREV